MAAKSKRTATFTGRNFNGTIVRGGRFVVSASQKIKSVPVAVGGLGARGKAAYARNGGTVKTY